MASSVRRLLSRLSGICEEIVNCPFIRGARKRLTTQAQRPGPREAWIATRSAMAGLGAGRQCNCRLKPKIRIPVKVERIAADRDGDFLLRLIARQDSLPCSLEKLQFCIGWLICSAFGVGGELLACVCDERGDYANNGDDMSK